MFHGIQFPYFNSQQLNLDWIVDKIKGMLDFLPDDGTAGQILRRTADGAEWSDEETGGAVESVNGKTGAVVLDKTDIGLGNVANVAQYSASNPPPYPVTSVNGQTGAVTVQTATDAQVTTAVNTWLGENVAQETGYVLDSTLTMSNAAPPASAVGDLKSAIGNLDLSVLFEMGSANTNSSGFTYANNYERVRIKQGTTIHLKEGDVIGLTDYTDAQFMFAWRRTSTGTYNSDGWFTANKTITQEGDYVIVIQNRTAKTQTSPYALASLFFGYQAIAFDAINKNIDDIVGLSQIAVLTYPGYIAADGAKSLPYAPNQQRMTEKISCSPGDKFRVVLAYNPNHGQTAYYALYDKTGNYLERVAYIAANNVWYDVEITISNENAAFIAFQYDTYGLPADFRVYSNKRNSPREWKELIQNALNAKNMISCNHRGWYYYPENTIIAYKGSRKEGFDYAECDVRFTSDGVPVLLHDETINRTARNTDGTSISETIYISNITLAQARQYDFGIYRDPQYPGTQIPTLAEYFLFCKKSGLKPWVEIKPMTQAQVEQIVDLAADYDLQDTVIWCSSSSTLLGYVANRYASATLALIKETGVDSETISTINALKTSSNKVWLATSDLSANTASLCRAADIPLSVYSLNTRTSIATVPAYVSAIMSDRINPVVESYLMSM